MFNLNKITPIKPLSAKMYLDGKSYKISKKTTIYNMRFNRANKNICVLLNTNFLNKGGQKKLYINNSFLIKTSLRKLINKIRGINTYTLRGVWLNSNVIDKRSGRVSEYM